MPVVSRPDSTAETLLEIQLFLDHQSVSQSVRQSCSDYCSLHCYMIFEQNGCGNGLLKNAPQLLAFFIKTTTTT